MFRGVFDYFNLKVALQDYNFYWSQWGFINFATQDSVDLL